MVPPPCSEYVDACPMFSTHPSNITCQKYVLPHLRPPSATAYEEDRDALTAQFDAAEALLKEIQAETSAVRVAVEEQRDRIDKTTSEVDAAVKEMREGEAKTREDLASISTLR